MKNKGLIVSIVALFIFLVVSFGYELGSHSQATEKESHEVKKVQTIGILQFISHPALDQIKQGIIDGLKEEGYTEGKNIKIDFLNGQGDQTKLQTMSQQLIEKGSDILIPIATPAAKAMANETTKIPIIASGISDPVGSGLVKNLEHPEGNITGVKTEAPVKDQVDLLKKLLPNAKKIGVIYSAGEENSKSYVKTIQDYAQKQGYEVKPYAIQSSNELASTVQVMNQDVDVIYVPQDNGIASAFQTLINEANKANKPVFVSVDNMVEQGGLATVGQNQHDLGVRTAKLAVKMLKDKQQKTLPFDVVSNGDSIVNQKVATKLGIQIPEDVLKSAKIIGGN